VHLKLLSAQGVERRLISGIAINTIVNGKESGLVVLNKKELYKASITTDANLSDWKNLLVSDAANDGKSPATRYTGRAFQLTKTIFT
jgi:hypothetical protein